MRKGPSDGAEVALIVYHRDGPQLVGLVPEAPLIIGRAEPADVVVPDRSLSRLHARLTVEDDGRVSVEDLGSTNGTWLAGDCVERTTVRPGTSMRLGAVHVAIHARTGEGNPYLGLDSHDRFLAALEEEIVRARHFGRPAAVVMLRAVGGRDEHLHRWTPAVQAALRPVDRVALYSGDSVELLLPETTAAEAAQLARSLAAAHEDQQPTLVCGVGSFPESGTSTEALVEACRAAALAAHEDEPVCLAQPTSAVVLPGREPGQRPADEPIAESRAMREALRLARRLARGLIPVLLQGETGTGKEVVARFIHGHGPRAEQSMVSVNCAAIPAQLVESTLFGHEKGSFTGATRRHEGVFEAAHGGTVLLDEIGELPPSAQAALLRVLEGKAVTRVGATTETPVDVRIMAASHRDLELMTETGEFRQDLLYRLNALTLRIPPLRERRADVEALALHFLQLANESNRRHLTGIEPEALAALLAYPWPGNVRELRNVIDRAVVLAEHDVVSLIDLPMAVRRTVQGGDEADDGERKPPGGEADPVGEDPPGAPADGARALRREGEDFRSCMERLEIRVLLDALQEADGNQTEAARLLQMPRRTLVYKLRALGIRKGSHEVDRDRAES